MIKILSTKLGGNINQKEPLHKSDGIRQTTTSACRFSMIAKMHAKIRRLKLAWTLLMHSMFYIQAIVSDNNHFINIRTDDTFMHVYCVCFADIVNKTPGLNR